ncbi:MAG: acyl-CoA dehydrogenase [Legionellales bacterium]|nr:acyl-CoA dehydrogenase [Legionellales bacterium]
MLVLLEFLTLLGIVWGLAAYQVSRLVWTPVVGLTLLAFSVFSHLSWPVLTLCWLLYLIPVIIFNVSFIRYELISLPVLKFFRKALPPMSETEREALDAGDVWLEGDLFCGRPNWQRLFNTQYTVLTAEEQAFINHQVPALCNMLNDWEVVHQEHDIPERAWNYLKKEKFFGLVIPKQYGGLGFSALAHAAVVTRLSTHCISAAVTAMVPNSLGPGELLVKYGTDEQKNYYLPRLAAGEEIPCFGLTGPDSGSDAANMNDLGVVCRGKFEGKEMLGIRLNFEKRYITLAPVATVIGVAFRLTDPDHLLGEKTEIGITLALLPGDYPGIQHGERHWPLGMSFMNGPVRGKDIFVPFDWIIGGKEKMGQGWRMLMECLSIGRSISLPAIGVACGQLAFRTTGAYARVRKQFRMSIGNFDGVQEAMGRIGGLTYINNAAQKLTCTAVDQHVKPAVVSAIAKLHLTNNARQIINDAMDVHAGRGVQIGPNNYLAHGYFALPISITVEGANILTRNLIIFGQGAVRCHPFVRDEMAAASIENKTEALEKFDRLLLSHIGFTISNVARSLWYGISGGRFIASPVKGKTAKYHQQLTRMSCALAMMADFSMMFLGGALKRKERLSARLGDVLSYLYLGSAVLKYHESQGHAQEDLPFIHWAMSYCLFNIQEAFANFLDNFPIKNVRWLFRRFIFFWGRSYEPPRDSLDRKISQIMMEPSALRDRITESCYLSSEPTNPVRLMEEALQKMVACDPIQKKIYNAQRNGVLARDAHFEEIVQAALKASVIDANEAKLLREFESIREQVIAVDEFPADYFKRNLESCLNTKVA